MTIRAAPYRCELAIQINDVLAAADYLVFLCGVKFKKMRKCFELEINTSWSDNQNFLFNSLSGSNFLSDRARQPLSEILLLSWWYCCYWIRRRGGCSSTSREEGATLRCNVVVVLLSERVHSCSFSILGVLRRERCLTLPTCTTLSKQIFAEVNGNDYLLLALPLLFIDGLDNIGEGDGIEQFPTYLSRNCTEGVVGIGRGLPYFLLKE